MRVTAYIISYDIPDDKRRNKVARALMDMGERRQYSVFECNLTPRQHRELWDKLADIIDTQEDSILCFPLCGRCQKAAMSLGQSQALLGDPAYYIV